MDLLHAIGTGITLSLLGKPQGEHKGLSEAARDAVFAAILADAVPLSGAGPAAAATKLRASLDSVSDLSAGERLLLGELLHRIADTK